MSIKSDKWIKRMSINNNMIEPFVDDNVRSRSISYGFLLMVMIFVFLMSIKYLLM